MSLKGIALILFLLFYLFSYLMRAMAKNNEEKNKSRKKVDYDVYQGDEYIDEIGDEEKEEEVPNWAKQLLGMEIMPEKNGQKKAVSEVKNKKIDRLDTVRKDVKTNRIVEGSRTTIQEKKVDVLMNEEEQMTDFTIKDTEDVKRAFILGEILQRKY